MHAWIKRWEFIMLMTELKFQADNARRRADKARLKWGEIQFLEVPAQNVCEFTNCRIPWNDPMECSIAVGNTEWDNMLASNYGYNIELGSDGPNETAAAIALFRFPKKTWEHRSNFIACLTID
jgi:hypothetical protein